MRTIGITSFTWWELGGSVWAMNAIHHNAHVPVTGRTVDVSRRRWDGLQRVWRSDHRRLTAEEVRDAVRLFREALLSDGEAYIDGAGI